VVAPALLGAEKVWFTNCTQTGSLGMELPTRRPARFCDNASQKAGEGKGKLMQTQEKGLVHQVVAMEEPVTGFSSASPSDMDARSFAVVLSLIAFVATLILSPGHLRLCLRLVRRPVVALSLRCRCSSCSLVSRWRSPAARA